jgi:hypothetical protein
MYGPERPLTEFEAWRRFDPARFEQEVERVRLLREDPERFERSTRDLLEVEFRRVERDRYVPGVYLTSVTMQGSYPDTAVVAIWTDELSPGHRFSRTVQIWDEECLLRDGFDHEYMHLLEEIDAVGYGMPTPAYPPRERPIEIGWGRVSLAEAVEMAPFGVLAPAPLLVPGDLQATYLYEERRRFRPRASLVGLYTIDGGRLMVAQTEGLHHAIPQEGWQPLERFDGPTMLRDELYEPGRWRWTAWRFAPDDWLPLRTWFRTFDDSQVYAESDVLSRDDLIEIAGSLAPVRS